jgi:hypothetical protein
LLNIKKDAFTKEDSEEESLTALSNTKVKDKDKEIKEASDINLGA